MRLYAARAGQRRWRVFVPDRPNIIRTEVTADSILWDSGEAIQWDAGDPIDWDTAEEDNVIVRKFPFAFDTPNILTGATMYVPTVDDILLDVWIEVVTEWDGTSPLADVGTFVDTHLGVFGWLGPSKPDLTTAGNESQIGTGLHTTGTYNRLSGWDAVNGVWDMLRVDGTQPTPYPFLYRAGLSSLSDGQTAVFRFTAANPIKVCVSQDGTSDGADPGSTQGSAVLYLVTATPV